MDACIIYFVYEEVVGILSKVLIMSIVVNNVLYASFFFAFRLSNIVCVMYVRRLLVECFHLKPCSTRERVMCVVISSRTIFSSTLKSVERNAVSLY